MRGVLDAWLDRVLENCELDSKFPGREPPVALQQVLAAPGAGCDVVYTRVLRAVVDPRSSVLRSRHAFELLPTV